jgi:hypothetical protein
LMARTGQADVCLRAGVLLGVFLLAGARPVDLDWVDRERVGLD